MPDEINDYSQTKKVILLKILHPELGTFGNLESNPLSNHPLEPENQ